MAFRYSLYDSLSSMEYVKEHTSIYLHQILTGAYFYINFHYRFSEACAPISQSKKEGLALINRCCPGELPCNNLADIVENNEQRIVLSNPLSISSQITNISCHFKCVVNGKK